MRIHFFRKSSSYPFFNEVGKNNCKKYLEFYINANKREFFFNLYESIRLAI